MLFAHEHIAHSDSTFQLYISLIEKKKCISVNFTLLEIYFSSPILDFLAEKSVSYLSYFLQITYLTSFSSFL